MNPFNHLVLIFEITVHKETNNQPNIQTLQWEDKLLCWSRHDYLKNCCFFKPFMRKSVYYIMNSSWLKAIIFNSVLKSLNTRTKDCSCLTQLKISNVYLDHFYISVRRDQKSFKFHFLCLWKKDLLGRNTWYYSMHTWKGNYLRLSDFFSSRRLRHFGKTRCQ